MTIKSQISADLPGGPNRSRISRIEAYMAIANTMALRSTCRRGQVGCVAVKDNRIICVGYNGAPSGMRDCLEVGCGGGVLSVSPSDPNPLLLGPIPLEQFTMGTEWIFPNGCTRSIHAEMNMVAFAAKHGLSLDGCTVYATHAPCLPCAQALISAGTLVLYYKTPYRLPEGLRLMDEACVIVHRVDEDE